MNFTISMTGLIAASLLLAACRTHELPETLQPNSGSTLTTRPGEQLTQDMFFGKWDLDGQRTNAANGNSSITSIPDNIAKDIFGTGWRFLGKGVLEIDTATGSKPGNWRLEGKDTLVVRDLAQTEEKMYPVHFRVGYMYLRRPDGTWLVFEKDKYFGF